MGTSHNPTITAKLHLGVAVEGVAVLGVAVLGVAVLHVTKCYSIIGCSCDAGG